MSSLDVAGVVGTWVAVGLATFALIGVVGPLLVWRASKSARNQALAKLDEGLSTSGGFVDKGRHFGPDIYLFRRVRAPMLSTPPELAGWKPKWDTSTDLPPRESAGWVQLSSVLRSHGLTYQTGDALIFRHETTRLKMSTTWLVVLGLIGRFGSRSDSGEWLEEPTRDVVFEQAIPGQLLGRRFRGRARKLRRNDFGAAPEADPLWTRDENTYDGKLYGLTGTMRCEQEHGYGVVDFQAHEKSRIAGLSEEMLDVAGLFWLSMGCLPMAGGKVFYLGDVIYPTQPSRPRQNTARARQYYPTDAYPAFARPMPAPPTPVSSVWSDPTEMPHQRPRLDEPRKWSFVMIQDHLSDPMKTIADALGAEQNASKLSLTDLEATPDEVAALREDARRTFIPSHRPWVRLGPPVTNDSADSGFFLDLASAQLLARAMLQLPICEQGYLVHVPPGSACWDMLVEASSLLPRLLYFLVVHSDRVKEHILQVGSGDAVFASMETLLLMTPRSEYSYSRLFASVMFKLDRALAETISTTSGVHLFVQVLAVTNPEFRDLINRSLRDLEACFDSCVTFDATTATVGIGTILGAVKRFPIDLNVILDNPQAFVRSGTTEVPYVDVLFLLLKACLRSTFLVTSLDSTPLFEAVFKPGGDTFEAY